VTAFALTDATVIVAGTDFSGVANSVTLSAEAEDLDATTFRSGGYRARVAGLKTVSLDVAGNWDPAPDADVFSSIVSGARGRPALVSPTNVEGATAYLFQGGHYSYSQFGDVGSLAPFSVNTLSETKAGLVRGVMLKRADNSRGVPEPVSATGVVGQPVNLGAVTLGKWLYGSIHVLTAGTTVSAVIESAADNTFAGATTRISFGPITAAGGTWGTRLAGPVTDGWYRLRVTAITGSFKIAAAVGIG
jgi:hypothetical protein